MMITITFLIEKLLTGLRAYSLYEGAAILYLSMVLCCNSDEIGPFGLEKLRELLIAIQEV